MADEKIATLQRAYHVPRQPSDAVLQAIRERLSYNSHSGEIAWQAPPSSSPMKVGSRAGAANHRGYVTIGVRVNGRSNSYYANHIAW